MFELGGIEFISAPAEPTTRSNPNPLYSPLLLQRMSYPNRHVDMEHFFQRSIGYISETVEAVRVYLDQIAKKLLLEFDHRRVVPLIPVFAAAFRAKGCRLPHVWALLDGAFRDFAARPRTATPASPRRSSTTARRGSTATITRGSRPQMAS